MIKKQATVTWLTGMTFDAHMGDHHIMIDAGGDNGANRGPTPIALTLTALGGCTAMDVVSILRKKRQDFDDVVVRVDGIQAESHPHRFTEIVMTYEVTGDGVDPKAVARAVALSEEKYCSVSATLKEETEIGTRVVVNGEEYAAE